jgi:hypothetical protein
VRKISGKGHFENLERDVIITLRRVFGKVLRMVSGLNWLRIIYNGFGISGFDRSGCSITSRE